MQVRKISNELKGRINQLRGNKSLDEFVTECVEWYLRDLGKRQGIIKTRKEKAKEKQKDKDNQPENPEV